MGVFIVFFVVGKEKTWLLQLAEKPEAVGTPSEKCLPISYPAVLQKFHTGLSHDILQKFCYGISVAAYSCWSARKIDISKITLAPFPFLPADKAV